MADAVEDAIAEILTIAGSLGLPVEINYPYDPDADELPIVLVNTGEEEVVEEDGMPADGWAVYWRITPSIEVLINRTDPMAVHADLNEKWATLRAAIEDSKLLDLIRPGSKPELSKLPIVLDEKPGVAGFAVSMTMEIERD
jgi:hypothetical protein